MTEKMVIVLRDIAKRKKNAQLSVAGTSLYIVQEILSPLRERKFTGGVFTYLHKKNPMVQSGRAFARIGCNRYFSLKTILPFVMRPCIPTCLISPLIICVATMPLLWWLFRMLRAWSSMIVRLRCRCCLHWRWPVPSADIIPMIRVSCPCRR